MIREVLLELRWTRGVSVVSAGRGAHKGADGAERRPEGADGGAPAAAGGQTAQTRLQQEDRVICWLVAQSRTSSCPVCRLQDQQQKWVGAATVWTLWRKLW